MPKFNVETFLREHRIHYVTSGANWSPGNVMIKCPWCSDDPSEHMGIHTNTLSYACWRNKQHRGKKLQRVIMALLGCSWETASEYLGKRTHALNQFDAFAKDPKSYFQNITSKQDRPNKLRFPEEIRPLAPKRNKAATRSRIFHHYLRSRRGFTAPQAAWAINTYDLHWCVSGYWRNRLIVPVYHANRLVCWTGRHIGSHSVRYKTLTPNVDRAEANDQPPAIMAPNETLFDYDQLLKYGGNSLYVCEGPFDAIKLSTLGHKYGISATCLFTKDPTRIQIALLRHLQRKFHNLYILLDQVEIASAMQLKADLSHLGAEIKMLPRGIKDPGDLTADTLPILLK